MEERTRDIEGGRKRERERAACAAAVDAARTEVERINFVQRRKVKVAMCKEKKKEKRGKRGGRQNMRIYGFVDT